MAQEMRKFIDSFSEYLHKTTNREVIVSYDVTADYEKLRRGLLDLLEEFGTERLTKSTYKLKRRLNGIELDELSTKIRHIFDEIKARLNERERYQKEVKVVIITSMDNTFFTESVIDEIL